MTSGRKPPAGAPRGWENRAPAGAPDDEAAPGTAPDRRQTRSGPAPDAAPAEVDEGGAQVQEDLDALLADVKRERDEYLELAQRAKADFENYRKRAAREAQEAERRGRATLARELVPVLDNLERALRASGVDPETETAGDEAGDGSGLAHGVRLTYRELRATLERAGVEAYDPAGERFDPQWHEALQTRADEGVESGVVLETLEKGYRLDGQVLRAARVVVSE